MSLPPGTILTKRELRSGALYQLRNSEVWWRDRQTALEARGYLLRPRFRHGWEPSWLKKNAKEKDPLFSEDSLFLPVRVLQHPKAIDATRSSDGQVVYIKKISKFDSELPIARFLCSPEKLQDHRNHCVRVLDDFDDDIEPETSFIVMPLLRRFDDPDFFSVDEVVDFIRQTLEGLSFIHANDVAHRDCSFSNIMMDCADMYPRGFHATHQYRTKDSKEMASHCHRRDVVAGVKYYFTDFGISTHFQDPGKPRLVTGNVCQDHEVPELSNIIPYDPFAVDVFLLGNVYKKTFLKEYTNLSFLEPLIDSMTRFRPDLRPTVDEAISQFEELVKRQEGKALRWRLKRPGAGRFSTFVDDVPFIWREFVLRVKDRLQRIYSL